MTARAVTSVILVELSASKQKMESQASFQVSAVLLASAAEIALELAPCWHHQWMPRKWKQTSSLLSELSFFLVLQPTASFSLLLHLHAPLLPPHHHSFGLVVISKKIMMKRGKD